MARYRIGMDEMEEYVSIFTGKIENAAKKFGLELDGDAYYAPSKKIYNDFQKRLAPTREQKEYESAVKNGVPTWKKDDYSGKWLVLISGDRVLPGTVVEVKKRDGAVSQVKILKPGRNTDEGFLYEVQDVTERPAAVFVAPANSNLDFIRTAATELDVSVYTFLVEKIGRKWIEVLVDSKNGSKYRAKLLIDDTTRVLSVGGFYSVMCKFVDESDGYGKKFFLYPLYENAIAVRIEKKRVLLEEKRAEAAAKAKADEEIRHERLVSQWLEWTRDKAESGVLYTKGVATLTDLGVWDEYKDEIESKIAEVSAAKAAEQAAKVEEDAKYTWLNIPPRSVSIPSSGELMFYQGKAYEVLSKRYVPEHYPGEDDDGGYDGSMCDEHYDVKAIDVSHTDRGQSLIIEQTAKIEAERAERKRISDIIKAIQEKGENLGRLEDIDIPAGDKILNTRNLYGGGEIISLTPTDAWFISTWDVVFKAPRSVVEGFLQGATKAKQTTTARANGLRSEVMRAAWSIAKSAAAQYGGSSKDFIGDAMRMAWAQVKKRAA